MQEVIMKIGYYKDDLEHIESEGLSAKDIAVLYAYENHEIEEECDINFKIYVEDDEGTFRFDYSRDFIKWALLPPNYKKELFFLYWCCLLP